MDEWRWKWWQSRPGMSFGIHAISQQVTRTPPPPRYFGRWYGRASRSVDECWWRSNAITTLSRCTHLQSDASANNISLLFCVPFQFHDNLSANRAQHIPQPIKKRGWRLVCFTHKIKGFKSCHCHRSIHVSTLPRSAAQVQVEITIKCGLEKNFANWLIKCVCPVYIWLSFLLYFSNSTM